MLALHVHDEDSIPAFTDQPQHEQRRGRREFVARYCPWGLGEIRFETRVGETAELVADVADQTGCDVIALGWSQKLALGRAPIVRATLARSNIPVLLVPVQLMPDPVQTTAASPGAAGATHD